MCQYRAYGVKRGGNDYAFEPNYTGQRLDDTGLLYYGVRDYDPQLGAFISADTLIPDPTHYPAYNRYLYADANPLKYNDPTGHYIETLWDAANIGIGVVSLGYNLREGNWGDAAWDAGGLLVDVAATALPFIPGGAAAVIKAGRAAKLVNTGVDVVRAANAVDNVADAARAGNSLLKTVGGVQFKSYDRILELGTTLGSKFDQHHWIPQQFHRRLMEQYGSLPDELLDFTEPLEDGFHSYLHGKGGSLQDAYNDQIGEWLARNPPGESTVGEFVDQVTKLRDEYLKLYEEYILQ